MGIKNRSNIAAFRLGHTDLFGDKFGGLFSALQFGGKLIGVRSGDFAINKDYRISKVTWARSEKEDVVPTEPLTKLRPDWICFSEASLTQPERVRRWRDAGSATGLLLDRTGAIRHSLFLKGRMSAVDSLTFNSPSTLLLTSSCTICHGTRR